MIKLRFTEKHRVSSDQVVLIDYTVSDDPNLPPMTQSVGDFPVSRSTMGFSSRKLETSGLGNFKEVTVTFPNMNLVSRVK